jgi:hypothetical protein
MDHECPSLCTLPVGILGELERKTIHNQAREVTASDKNNNA